MKSGKDKFLGVGFIFLGLILNPFLVEHFFSPDQKFDFLWKYFVIGIFDLILILLGLFILLKKINVGKISLLLFQKRKEFLLMFLTIVFILIFMEVALRVYVGLSQGNELSRLQDSYTLSKNGSDVDLDKMVRISSREGVWYEFMPELNVTHKNVTVTTNSDGFRDSEFSREKKNNTIRVVGIGDSVMFGWGVEENERYMDFLESKLKEKYPQYDWDFMVLAVPGYNLDMELEVLKKYVDYEPDFVIYGLIFNDLCTSSLIYSKKSLFSTDSFLLDYFSKLGINKNLRLIGYDVQYFDWNKTCFNVPDKYSSYGGPENFENNLFELDNLSQSKDFSVVVFNLNFPEEDIYLDDTNITFEQINIYVREEIPRDILYVSSLNNFSNYRNLSLVISESDLHPNSKGHELAGEYLFYELESKGVISEIIRRHEAGL